jgi:hypothetical protein
MRSVSVVLPESMWALIPMFLIVDRSLNIVLPSVGFGLCCSQLFCDSLMVLWRRGRLARTNSAELE